MTKTLNEHLGPWQSARRQRRTIERWIIAGCAAVVLICVLAIAAHAEGNHNGSAMGDEGGNSPSSVAGGDENAGWWSFFGTPRYGIFVPSNQDLCGGDCDSRTFKGPFTAGPHPGIVATVAGWFRSFNQTVTNGGAPGLGGWSW